MARRWTVMSGKQSAILIQVNETDAGLRSNAAFTEHPPLLVV